MTLVYQREVPEVSAVTGVHVPSGTPGINPHLTSVSIIYPFDLRSDVHRGRSQGFVETLSQDDRPPTPPPSLCDFRNLYPSIFRILH